MTQNRGKLKVSLLDKILSSSYPNSIPEVRDFQSSPLLKVQRYEYVFLFVKFALIKYYLPLTLIAYERLGMPKIPSFWTLVTRSRMPFCLINFKVHFNEMLTFVSPYTFSSHSEVFQCLYPGDFSS